MDINFNELPNSRLSFKINFKFQFQSRAAGHSEMVHDPKLIPPVVRHFSSFLIVLFYLAVSRGFYL
jgi:hypothetical protein